MRERWMPVGIFVGALFAVIIAGRLMVRLAAGEHGEEPAWVDVVALLGIGLVALVAAIWWVVRHPMPRAAGELLLGIAVGCLLGALVGPFVSSGKAFGGGFGHFLGQLFTYLGVGAVGALFGGLGVVVAGADQRSKALARYAQAMQSRPRRVSRR